MGRSYIFLVISQTRSHKPALADTVSSGGEGAPWLTHMLVAAPLGLEARYATVVSPVWPFTGHFFHSKKEYDHLFSDCSEQ